MSITRRKTTMLLHLKETKLLRMLPGLWPAVAVSEERRYAV